jgi:hypothetical protein
LFGLACCLVLGVLSCSRAGDTGSEKYPHFVSLPTERTTARVRVNAAPWLCAERYRRMAAPVLQFIDETAARVQTQAKPRPVIKDARTGWSIVMPRPSRSANTHVVQLMIYPGGDNAADRWDSIARCKTIALGHMADADRLGLPNAVHRLYYAADIGLYLVKP